jgi:hypothetical protein
MNKCKCGGKIKFENKKTFTIPEIKRGVCIICGKQYEMIDGKVKEKGGD